MAITIVEITDHQRDVILSTEEGHFADLKSIDIKPSKLTKSISAFANASGGELYIGIDETVVGKTKKRTWRGFADQEAANSHIQVFEELFPLGQYYHYTFLEHSGSPGLVLQVSINKTREITVAHDNIPYLRRGAQSLPVNTPEALTRLKLDKGIVTFETETVNVDLNYVANSLVAIGFMLEVIPTDEPEAWLSKQLLIREGKPTVAGVLLFADEPQAILPKRSAIKIHRYGTTASEGSRATMMFDPLTIDGCLYNLIHKAVAKVVELVEEIPKLGEKGLENIRYPHETLHEIVTNAVLHRDYSIPADVHIRIFDNRIEVESPGRLPGHITRENILREQFARNGALVRIINKFPNPPNKDIGEGLNTAFFAMSNMRLKPPIIGEEENAVVVYIRHEPLASPEASVIEYLADHEEITNKIGRNITGITSENTMKDVFYKLRDKDLIELIPDRPRNLSAWRKVK